MATMSQDIRKFFLPKEPELRGEKGTRVCDKRGELQCAGGGRSLHDALRTREKESSVAFTSALQSACVSDCQTTHGSVSLAATARDTVTALMEMVDCLQSTAKEAQSSKTADCKSEAGVSDSAVGAPKQNLLQSLDSALRLLHTLYPTEEMIDALSVSNSAEHSKVQKKLLKTKQKPLHLLLLSLVKLETELKIQGILRSGLYLRREGWRRHRELADEYLSPWRVLVTDAHMCRTLSRVGDRLPVDGSAQPSAESLSIVSIPAFILQQIDGKLKAATRQTGERLPQPQFFLYTAYSQLSRFPELFANDRVNAVSFRNEHCPELLHRQMHECLSQVLASLFGARQTQSSACSTPMSECPSMQSVALQKESEEKRLEYDSICDEFADAKVVSEMRSALPLFVSNEVVVAGLSSEHNAIAAKGAGVPVSYAPVFNIASLRSLNVSLTIGNTFHGKASVANHCESTTTMTTTMAAASDSVDKAVIDASADECQTEAEVIARLKLLKSTISRGLLFTADLVSERFDETTEITALEFMESVFGREFSRSEKKKVHNSTRRAILGKQSEKDGRHSTILELFETEEKLWEKKLEKEKEERMKKRKEKRKKKAMSGDTLTNAETSHATGLRQRGRGRKRNQQVAVETDAESTATLQKRVKKKQKRSKTSAKKSRVRSKRRQ